MVEKELIFSIKDIFNVSGSSFIRENEFYNIPEYQRGYKWTSDEVITLLNDILKFQPQIIAKKTSDEKKNPTKEKGDTTVEKDNGLFYCVQNITLCKHVKNEETHYNIVDGQQRLTTILIILSFLEECEIVIGKVKYSIRDETDEFIKKYIIRRLIWEYNTWDELLFSMESNKDYKYKDKNYESEAILYNRKDVYYISQAAFAIKEWFTITKNKELEKLTILDHVKLIVNDLEGKDEEKIFSNLNGGHVPLDGADLVRGILMTRVAGEILGDDVNKERINEHRVRIGMELDSINLWWGDEKVATYFKQLLPDKLTKDKSFNVEIQPINILYKLYFETRANDIDEFSFKFFEYGIDKNEQEGDDHLEMYQGILKLHFEMQEWFVNREIYHLIGYLFNHFKSTEITFSKIHKDWEVSDSKEKFIATLKSIIFQQLNKPGNDEGNTTESDKFVELKTSIQELNTNWYDDGRLIKTLVLMDIIQITTSKNLGFLPVDSFRNDKEDKEHIRPQTPRKGKVESRSKNDWKVSVDGLNENVRTEINGIMERTQTDELSDEEMREIIIIINRLGLNSIGNIVLLNLSVNRSYGNAGYILKRRDILSNYMEGKYIRPHTLNAFVKKNSTEELNKWELEDIIQNAKRISTGLDSFFKNSISK